MAGVQRIAAATIVAAALASCSESTSVDPITVVSVTGPATTLLVGPGGGQTLQLTASARTQGGKDRAGVSYTWASDAPSIATVSASGVVNAVSAGTTSIRATTGRVTGALAVTVAPVPVRTLTLSEDSLALTSSPMLRESRVVLAQLRDSTGALLSGRTIVWSTTAPAVASVSPGGLVTALGSGLARVIATSEGRADSVAVAVTTVDSLPTAADVSIENALWTQGMQDDAGSVPIVRGGRAAVLNVTMSATLMIGTPSRLVLRILDAGGTLVRADTTAVIVPQGAAPSVENPTVQFLVPSSALQPGRRWQLVRDPGGALPDSSLGNDRFPRGSPGALPVVTVPTLRIRFIPIILTAHGNVTGNVSQANLAEYLRIVRALHPHGPLDISIGGALPNSRSFGTAPTGGGSDFWQGLIADIDLARVADAQFADAHWIGIVAPPQGFNFSTFGGYGYIPGNGASIGPFTRTTALVNAGWFSRDAATRELVAHELGHNFGRRHAPCGNAGGPDPSFPNAGGTIGAGAHDVYAWETGSATRAASVPTSVGDIMGYCSPVWSSLYTYQGIIDFRGATAAVVAAPEVRATVTGATGRTLMVRGTARGSKLTVEPAVALRLSTAATEPTGAGAAAEDHVVEGFDAAGRSLFTRRFALATLDHDETVRPFAVAVPVGEATLAALETIVVRGPGATARRGRPSDAFLVGADAAAAVRRTAAGLEVRCPASSSAMVVQDALTGAVLGTAQAASLTLPRDPRRPLEISCSDGVRTSASDVPAR